MNTKHKVSKLDLRSIFICDKTISSGNLGNSIFFTVNYKQKFIK